MHKNNSTKRLEAAQKRLFEALKDLEKSTIEKLHETSLHSNMFNIEGDDKALKSRVVEQTATIQKLNDEVNRLQEVNSELSNENESIAQQNESLLKRINQLRLNSADLVDSLEADLVQISRIIAKGE
jgi:FtsZ-binding cell division protein ZapB